MRNLKYSSYNTKQHFSAEDLHGKISLFALYIDYLNYTLPT